MKFPSSLQKLIEFFKLLPGVGEKTAIRYAFSLLKMNDDTLSNCSKLLNELKTNITTCPKCGAISENNKCLYCNDQNRKKDVICVVENQKDVFIFDKNGYFNGVYHVLGGLISPMDGVNPEDIGIDSLIKRVNNDKAKEVILALRPGIEASTTALYIKKILSNKNVKVTQVAQGIPIGADIEYLDDLTIEMALENRSEIE